MSLKNFKTIQRVPLFSMLVFLLSGLSLLFLTTNVLIAHHATLDSTWSLRAGQYMLAQHHIIRQDIFSYTLSLHPWISPEWGFEVWLAFLYNHAGAYGYFLAVLPPLLLLLFFLNILLHRVPFIYRFLLLEVAVFGVFSELYVRAQIYSYLFLVITFFILRFSPSTQILLFPPLILLWSNIHGSFPLGLGIYLLYFIFQPTIKRAFTFVLAAAATLVNPYGFHLWEYVFKLTFSPSISQYVGDWQSPNFHNLFLLALYLLPLILTARFFSWKSPLSYITLGAGIATLHSQRFGVYFILCFVYFISEHSFFQSPYDPWSVRKKASFKAYLFLNLATIFTLLVLAINLSTGINFSLKNIKSIPQNPIRPALLYIGNQPGRIFTLYNDSGGLIIANKKVFIDSRADFYMPTPVFKLYLQVVDGTSSSLRILHKYHIRWVILPQKTTLGELLHLSGVERVYHKHQLAIYELYGTKQGR